MPSVLVIIEPRSRPASLEPAVGYLTYQLKGRRVARNAWLIEGEGRTAESIRHSIGTFLPVDDGLIVAEINRETLIYREPYERALDTQPPKR